MRILFDHGTPSGIAAALEGHAVTEAIDRGWDRISNGELLRVLSNSTWRFVRPHLDRVCSVANAANSGSYTEVEIPLPPKKSFTRS